MRLRLVPSPFVRTRPDVTPPDLSGALEHGPAALAKGAWDEVMWCSTISQLQVVATRIRQVAHLLTRNDRQRLRQMYRIRLEHVGDPRGGPIR